MRAAGYSAATAQNPDKLTKSKGWKELLDQYLPEKKLLQSHKKLLAAKYLDHMVFPLGMPDDEISELIKSVGGTVRRFKHGDTATHVWFWADNTKAIKDAVEMAYRIRGKLKEGSAKVTDPDGRTLYLINMEPEDPKQDGVQTDS